MKEKRKMMRSVLIAVAFGLAGGCAISSEECDSEAAGDCGTPEPCEATGALQRPLVFEVNQPVSLAVYSCGSEISESTVTPPLPAGLVLSSAGTLEGTPVGRSGWTTHTFEVTSTAGELTVATPLVVHDPDMDWRELTEGVSAVDYGGSILSMIVPVGEWAFPVVMDGNNVPIVSAAHSGPGRVVGFGHEGMVSVSRGAEEARLALNAIEWACGGGAAAVALGTPFNHLEEALMARGHTVSTSVGPAFLEGQDCFVGELWNDYVGAENAALKNFVAGGGGLVMGGHAWYWGYSNTDVANNYSGNRILNTTGLFVSTSTGAGAATVGSVPPSRLHRTRVAVEALRKHLVGEAPLSPSEQSVVSGTLTRAVGELPLDYEDVWSPILEIASTVGWTLISEASPFDLRGDSLEELFLKIQEEILMQLPPSELPAHPGADTFPGAVPASAPRVTKTISIDGDFAGLPKGFVYAGARSDGRRTTGLYAAPGEVVTVTFPESVVGTGVNVLVGAHTDRLWGKESLVRHPVITRAWPASEATLKVANAFGGTLYIRVPAGSTLGSFEVTIENAVEAPHYVHGVTDIAAWKSTLRHLPAPWAELESGLFIMTVPSSSIRELDDPNGTMQFWDAALSMEHELSGYTPWPRVEMAVFDAQISVGYMHSGYPFMAPVTALYDSDAPVLNGAECYEKGNWGMFHELGHNHQWGSSTLPGNTETTCNFFSARLMTELVGNPIADGHPSQNEASREARAREFIESGSPIGDWSVWVALESHLQVQGAFGWGAITDALRAYYTMDDPPSGDAEEFNRWVVELSRATGYSLAAFYQGWGVPLTDLTRSALSNLPTWSVLPLSRWDAPPMDCGGHTARSCGECPWDESERWRGESGCAGECAWVSGECVWGG